SSEIAKLTHAVNQQTNTVTIAMTAILKQFQATPLPASVKSVEEICFTSGGAHLYFQCLATGGNTFPELRYNIQGYVAAAIVNYNQGNSVYRPPGSGSLPSNTIANPKGKLKAINTQSGIVLYGPSIPISPPFINSKEDEPVMLKKLPKKLRDPRKFLIPCGFNELKCKALANLGASINSMPLYVWKKLGLPDLISTRMTLELANRAICTPAGIARDVFILLGKFAFPADFVIVDYKSDPRILIPPNPLSGNTISSSSPNQLLEEFVDELDLLITFPLEYDDDLQFDIESDLKEIEYLLHHDPIKDIDSILKDSIDQSNLDDLNNNLVDSMPEMFTDEHALNYSSPSLYDEYDDDLFEVESNTENVYDDPFDCKGGKIKESKLLIDELDLPCDFLLLSEYDSFISEDFSKVDALPLNNNEDKVVNLGILIQENLFEVITHVSPEKKDKKLAISYASLMIEDFDPPLYELPFFKEVPRFNMLLSFSSKNKEKVFEPGIHTYGKVHSFLITEISHQGYKVFKINQIFKSPMKIFLFSYGKDTHILDVLCLHFYPLDQFKYMGIGSS
nr:reverse transcriptase domain-containing protein [Tanacetum cinerariifolium]